MIKTKLKRALAVIGALFCLGAVTSVAVAPVAYADASTEAAKINACEGIGGEYKNGKCETDGASLNDVIANVIKILSVLVGVAAVIMIMVGGFKYVTANGDSSNVSSAKNTIIYAIIGLVIAALAQVIVRFVIHNT